MSCTDQTDAQTGSAQDFVRDGTAGETASAAAATSSDTGRSFIVDERFFEEQFLRCQICHEKFDQAERSPKSLPCNHTFCLPCLVQVFDHAQPPTRRSPWTHETHDGTLKCPTCRVEIFLSKTKIKELPNDHRVIQMIDFLSQAVAKSQNVCTKHDGQPLNFFCKKCLIPVCRDCTVLDHKDSDGHKIVDVAEALGENSAQFNEIEAQSRETLEQMKNRSDCLANASKRLDILERHLKNEIKETFIEYRLLLEKRQEALVSMVHDIVQGHKTKINTKFVYVCEHGTQLQKLYDEFKTSKNSNDIRKLFSVKQQLIEHNSRFAKIASEGDLDLFQSCEFEAQNEGSFLSDMSSLGEVRVKPDPELHKPISAHQLMLLDMEERRDTQRLLDSQASYVLDSSVNYYYDEDNRAASRDEDEDDDDPQNYDPQNYWPSQSAVMSHLMSYYNRLGAEIPEAMDDGEGISVGNHRSRRGRRSRDTNSLQVQSTLNQDERNYFPISDPTSANNLSAPPVSYPRSEGRRHTSTGYRVVRHPTALSLRTQNIFRTEDSS